MKKRKGCLHYFLILLLVIAGAGALLGDWLSGGTVPENPFSGITEDTGADKGTEAAWSWTEGGTAGGGQEEGNSTSTEEETAKSSGSGAMTSISALAADLEKKMQAGEASPIRETVEGISREDIKGINSYLDSTIGSATRYTMEESPWGNTRVEIFWEPSSSRYVWQAYVNGSPIPEDQQEAAEVLNVVRQIMETVITPDLDDYGKELALHDYLVTHCTYGTSLEQDESEYTEYGALVKGRAVCGGYAAAMDLLLKCAGVETKYIRGTARNMRDAETGGAYEGHAWNQVKIDGNWYHLDATWDDPVGDREVLSHEYFNVTDTWLAGTHQWERKNYAPCTQETDNYFRRENLYCSDNPGLEQVVSAHLQEMLSSGGSSFEILIGDGVNISDETLSFIYETGSVSSASYGLTDFPGTGERILELQLK